MAKALTRRTSGTLPERRDDHVVVPHAPQRAAEGRADEHLRHDEDDAEADERKDEEEGGVILGRDERDERPRHVRDPQGAAGQPRFVEEHDPDDFAKADCHNGKIIVLQPHREEREQGAESGARHRSCGKTAEWASACEADERRSIGAERHKAADAEIHETRHAPLEIERETDMRRDHHENENGDEVGRHLRISLRPNSPCERNIRSSRMMRKPTACR